MNLQPSTVASLGDIYLAHMGPPFQDDGHWSPRLVREAWDKLAEAYPVFEEFEVHLILGRTPMAFTTLGKHVFITRKLVQHMPQAAAVAFVLSHEVAHHALGHVPSMPWWLGRKPGWKRQMAWIAANRLGRGGVQDAVFENQADALAIRMCGKAGFDPHEAARALQILERICLDRGATRMVYGDDAFYLADFDVRKRSRRIRRYLGWYGYYPLHVRRLLIEHAVGLRDGPPPVHLN